MQCVITPVRQTEAFDCMAACAAMITGQPLADVKAIIGHVGDRRPFTFREIASFLLLYGYHLGIPGRVMPSSKIGAPVTLVSLLIVEGRHGCRHSVLWDGRGVIDPLREGRQPLNDYSVMMRWPITQIGGV